MYVARLRAALYGAAWGEQGPLERLQTALSFLRLDEDAPSPSAGGSSNEEQARARAPLAGRRRRCLATRRALAVPKHVFGACWPCCGSAVRVGVQHAVPGIRGAAADWRPCAALERPSQAEQRTRLRADGRRPSADASPNTGGGGGAGRGLPAADASRARVPAPRVARGAAAAGAGAGAGGGVSRRARARVRGPGRPAPAAALGAPRRAAARRGRRAAPGARPPPPAAQAARRAAVRAPVSRLSGSGSRCALFTCRALFLRCRLSVRGASARAVTLRVGECTLRVPPDAIAAGCQLCGAPGPSPGRAALSQTPPDQVCTHPALASDAEAGPDEEPRPPSARLALLARLLPRLLAAGRRVLLLSQTAPALDLLQARPARGAARWHGGAVRCSMRGLGRSCWAAAPAGLAQRCCTRECVYAACAIHRTQTMCPSLRGLRAAPKRLCSPVLACQAKMPARRSAPGKRDLAPGGRDLSVGLD
jgi:hypothetical protein